MAPVDAFSDCDAAHLKAQRFMQLAVGTDRAAESQHVEGVVHRLLLGKGNQSAAAAEIAKATRKPFALSRSEVVDGDDLEDAIATYLQNSFSGLIEPGSFQDKELRSRHAAAQATLSALAPMNIFGAAPPVVATRSIATSYTQDASPLTPMSVCLLYTSPSPRD